MPSRPDSNRSTSERPDPNEKLVKVFDSEQESEAMVVNGLLASAGIDTDMTSLDAPQDTFPGVGGTVILVREEEAEEARRIIEEYRRSPAGDEETAEIDVSEEPPSAK
jgi:Putative prokaryotic signal transducing protein